jgi:hypothetical protein
LLQAQDAPTHYIDCNKKLIQLYKDFKRISQYLIDRKEKMIKLNDKISCKKREFNCYKDKTKDGSWYKTTKISLKKKNSTTLTTRR